MLKLGTATLQRIVDFDPFVLPLGFIFPGATVEAIRHAEPVLAPHHVDFAGGNILLGLHSLLLRSGGLNILIDTCVGENKERPRRAEWHRRSSTGYLDRLRHAGVSPAEIDVVLCTHLHADHVGWHTRLDNGRWIPTFPNARYLIGRTEMAHWQAAEAQEPGRHNHGAYADSVLPVLEAGLVELVDDGFDLAPGMRLEMLPGHSPGQMGLCLDCGGAGKALFCGDAVHSPVQVFQPEWASAFCSDREQAISTRLGLFERSSEENTLLILAHLRGAWGMGVERKGSGYSPTFVR
jgi:glyoxylase-like metal-dependent hydrolase (beta-lactamase superfamily II)